MKQFYDNLTQRQLTHLIFGGFIVVAALVIFGIVYVPKFVAIAFSLFFLGIGVFLLSTLFYVIAFSIAEQLKR